MLSLLHTEYINNNILHAHCINAWIEEVIGFNRSASRIFFLTFLYYLPFLHHWKVNDVYIELWEIFLSQSFRIYYALLTIFLFQFPIQRNICISAEFSLRLMRGRLGFCALRGPERAFSFLPSRLTLELDWFFFSNRRGFHRIVVSGPTKPDSALIYSCTVI